MLLNLLLLPLHCSLNGNAPSEVLIWTWFGTFPGSQVLNEDAEEELEVRKSWWCSASSEKGEAKKKGPGLILDSSEGKDLKT